MQVLFRFVIKECVDDISVFFFFRISFQDVAAKSSSSIQVNIQPIHFSKKKKHISSHSIPSHLGISHAYGGALSALSIYYTLTPIGDDASKRWREKEVVSALYHDRQEVLAVDEREIVGDFMHDEV